jgi:hypothetical protein
LFWSGILLVCGIIPLWVWNRFLILAAVATAAMTASEAFCTGEGVLATTVVAGVAYMPLAVTGFVGVEVVEARLSTAGKRAVVAIMRVKTVIDVAMEAVRTVEPGTGSDEHSADKPVGAIVAVWGAIIGRVVEVAVGALGRHANVDTDSNLGRG